MVNSEAIEQMELRIAPVEVRDFRLIGLQSATWFEVNDHVTIYDEEVSFLVLEGHWVGTDIVAIDFWAFFHVPVYDAVNFFRLSHPDSNFIWVWSTPDSPDLRLVFINWFVNANG